MGRKGDAAQGPLGENAERFELLLDAYRRADGEVWKGTELARETNPTVSSSYVTAIRSGGIKQPGDKYRRALANTMGFPFEYWFMPVDQLRRELARQGRTGRSHRSRWAGGKQLADLVGDQVAWMMLARGVLDVTDREISEAGGGRLTEKEIRAMRLGEAGPLSEAQALVLSDVFGIAPKYWEAGPPRRDLITPEAASRILSNDKVLVLQDSAESSDEVNTVAQVVARLLRQGGEGGLAPEPDGGGGA